MWTSVPRLWTTAASTPSARTPWGRTNASASRAIKGTASIVKVKVWTASMITFTCSRLKHRPLPTLPHHLPRWRSLSLIISPWAGDRPDESSCLSQNNLLAQNLLRFGGQRGESMGEEREGAGAECSFVTRWNEAVNVLHMLEERIKIATEAAAGGRAKQSGIFPQPEARASQTVRHKSVILDSLCVPQASGSLYPTILLVLLQNHISLCHFFPCYYYSFIYLSECFSWPRACRL